MIEFEQKLGYRFKDSSLLKNALTHSSYSNEMKIPSNERLEFLGDSVLSVIVSDYLFRNLKEESEGNLSKIRASLVCEQALTEFAKGICLDEYICLGRGEEITGGRKRASIISDAFEAVLAAIYLDGGIEEARKWLLSVMKSDLEKAIMRINYRDYKTVLQETTQKNGLGKVTYRTVSESGPDHDKSFHVEVLVDEIVKSDARGASKKEAEQKAAMQVLQQMGKV